MRGIVQVKTDRPNYYIVLDYIDVKTGRRKRPYLMKFKSCAHI